MGGVASTFSRVPRTWFEKLKLWKRAWQTEI
jgi:hypothetical protein